MTLLYKKLMAALPIAMMLFGASACSNDSDPAPVKEAADGIMLSIPIAGTRAGEKQLTDISHLYIATYGKDGTKKDDIVIKGGMNTENRKKDSGLTDAEKSRFSKEGIDNTNSTLGTLVSVYLPASKYANAKNDGLLFVAFHLPDMGSFGVDAGFTPPAKLSDLYTAVENVYKGGLLSMPSSANGVWQPTNEMDIPMAGVLDVTSALNAYDPVLWNENNPMLLDHDHLILIRSMAKVVIKNGDKDNHFITGVEFKSTTKGSLIPNCEDETIWKFSQQVSKPTLIANAPTAIMQQGTVSKSATASSQHEYVFYTFETALKTSLDNEANKLIKLYWGEREPKDVYFQPTTSGTLGQGHWTGILRNHIYTFNIIKPGESKLTVEVKANPWGYEHYETEF